MTAHDELIKLAAELDHANEQIRIRDTLYRREIDQLKAQVEELEQCKKNAERYTFLKKNFLVAETFHCGIPINDAAIDAAIASAEGNV